MMAGGWIYWTVRNTSGRRWTPESGWKDKAAAERNAKNLRYEYRRRCVVVPCRPGALPTDEQLRRAVR